MQTIRILLCAVALSVSATAVAQDTTTILFDNSGTENGVTTPGTTDFSFMGSNWSGGVVRTEGITALYASGAFSYEINENTAGSVSFDTPMDSVRFFYVHGFGFSSGTATAFDDQGAELGSVASNQATSFGAQGNFVTLDFATDISRVDFTSGVIDNFSYTEPVPGGGGDDDDDGGGEPEFVINFGVTGSWFNSFTAGQGWLFEVVPSFDPPVLVAYNFTFPVADAAAKGFSGSQMWLVGAGEIDGDTVVIEADRPVDGIFDDPLGPMVENWGTITIVFEDCFTAMVSYASGLDGVEGSFGIERITPDVMCEQLAE